jgi:5-methylcytosine-specific restriction endonuclease McrA
LSRRRLTINPYDRAWRQVRLAILARDGHRCRLAYPHCCVGTATEVDHIIELHAGGARLDPANLQAACKPCNSSKGATYRNGQREPHSVAWYTSTPATTLRDRME